MIVRLPTLLAASLLLTACPPTQDRGEWFPRYDYSDGELDLSQDRYSYDEYGGYDEYESYTPMGERWIGVESDRRQTLDGAITMDLGGVQADAETNGGATRVDAFNDSSGYMIVDIVVDDLQTGRAMLGLDILGDASLLQPGFVAEFSPAADFWNADLHVDAIGCSSTLGVADDEWETDLLADEVTIRVEESDAAEGAIEIEIEARFHDFDTGTDNVAQGRATLVPEL